MPLDAICLQGVVGELAPQLTGSRIEKIQQPARDQIILLLRGSRRLFLNAGANQPRIHLTEQLRDNPSQPPMFCMLLRKHLSGGIIESVRQEPLERVVTLTVLASDEMGERSRFTLVWEGMPRRANLILCDRDGRIIDCLRRVDLEAEQDRQVLPGLFYRLPTRQDKRSPLSVTEEEFAGYLYSAGIPDPDLLIRPGGEVRISNFLLWQCAYSEFYFTDVLWPDFTPEELDRAIDAFRRRDRRYGGVKNP